LAKAATSGASWRNWAKAFSTLLSQVTRLKTVLRAANVGREYGNGGVPVGLLLDDATRPDLPRSAKPSGGIPMP
jgi:hypothetical protein